MLGQVKELQQVKDARTGEGRDDMKDVMMDAMAGKGF